MPSPDSQSEWDEPIKPRDLLDVVRDDAAALIAHHAMMCSAVALARLICEYHDLEFDQVWNVIEHLPDQSLILLESAQGWEAIGEQAALSLGAEFPSAYFVTVH